MWLWARRWLTFIAFCGVVVFVSASADPAVTPKPRLAVLVVFDQLRGDYLTRWNDLFDKGGFRRLEEDGAWFQNCNYPYSQTLTGPGHASLSTGCSPMKHGIVGNVWYDWSTHSQVYCATGDFYELVPLHRGPLRHQFGRWPGGWPGWLMVDSLGDAFKKGTGGKGRVVCLSLKDRGAVFFSCRHAATDACYWFFPSRGIFVTSTYYRRNGQPHPWVAAFNERHPADQWFGKQWTRLRPNLDYARHSGPEFVADAGTGWVQGRTFPHRMTGGLKKPGESYYGAVCCSPFGNELLLDLAKQAIDAERLGNRDVPDLLCLSFSCNDPIGHSWGPDSQEILDTVLRSDRIVKELLEYLDAKVGRGRYVLALAGDHGVCPLQSVARKSGKRAGRVSCDLLTDKASEFLDETYLKNGDGDHWIKTVQRSEVKASEVYFNPGVLRKHHLRQADVEKTLAEWLNRQPGVQKAYTRTQLLTESLSNDPVAACVRRSFHPKRSGDVAVVLKPYYLWGDALEKGTSHGSPHPYDTHVPLLIYGPGIRPGIRREAVVPQAMAAILTDRMGMKPPSGADTPVPDGLQR
jgi:predicted AlkP superfamily pyrophosphatase or phosphodiesterase